MIIIILCICYQGSIYWEGGSFPPKKAQIHSPPPPKLQIIIVLLPNSVYSDLQNSCHECGLRRKNECGQPKTCSVEYSQLYCNWAEVKPNQLEYRVGFTHSRGYKVIIIQ